MTNRSLVTANAGSGKTYLLANRLIRWMIEHRRSDPAHRCGADAILAITFTRKAAGEILDRLLWHLAQGATIPTKREDFAVPSMIGPATEVEYREVLGQVLDHLDRLSIGTLDSFFSRLARAFSAEVGLPPQWTIATTDRDEEQRSLAASRVLALDASATWPLVRMASGGAPAATVLGGVLRGLEAPLRQLELCALHGVGDAPWHALANTPLFADAAQLDANGIQRATDAIIAAPLPLTGKGAQDTRFVTARDHLLRAVKRGAWTDLIMAENKLAFGAKIAVGMTHATKAPDPALVDAVRPLVHHALAIQCKIIQQRLEGVHGLAQRIQSELEAIRREQGAYSFGAITAAMARAHQLDGEGLQAMRFRLDCALRDLAIDECQDTSPEQYAVLAPFMDEIFSSDSGRRFLMVGDPKQSIFGWRGGTPALIGHIRDERAPGLEPDVQLDTSRRSHPALLAFVNAIFSTSDQGTLAQRLKRIDPEPQSAAEGLAALREANIPAPDRVGRDAIDRVLDDWTFVTHRCDPALADRPGTVAAWLADAGPKAAWATTAARLAIEASAARPLATVAVIVHTNKQVGAVIAALRAQGVRASDEGRGSIMDAMGVVVLMALLRLAEQPLDGYSQLLVAQPAIREALASVVALPAPDERSAAAIGSQRIREGLHEHGLAQWLERAAGAIGPLCGARDQIRLQQVLALAATAPAEMASRPEQFVRLVESTGSRTVSGDPIRVMTIHQSKGLEFDEVILPTLKDGMDTLKSQGDGLAVLTDGPGGTPLAICPLVPKPLCMLSPLLAAMRSEVRVLRLFDGLSALYVALTRAKSAVKLVCERMSSDEANGKNLPVERLSPLWLLRTSLPHLDTAYKAAHHAAANGEPFWGDASATPALAELDRTTKRRLVAHQVPPEGLPLVQVGPGSNPHQARIRVNLPESIGDAAAMRRGSIVHALLRQVTWLGEAPDFGLTVEAITAAHALVQAELRTHIPAAELDSAVAFARASLAGPIGTALRTPDAGPDGIEWVAKGELPFQRRAHDRTGARGRLDRIAIACVGGRITQAQVYDFKTGSLHQTPSEIRDHYRQQTDGYREAVAELTGLPSASVSVSLLMLDRGDVIPA